MRSCVKIVEKKKKRFTEHPAVKCESLGAQVWSRTLVEIEPLLHSFNAKDDTAVRPPPSLPLPKPLLLFGR